MAPATTSLRGKQIRVRIAEIEFANRRSLVTVPTPPESAAHTFQLEACSTAPAERDALLHCLKGGAGLEVDPLAERPVAPGSTTRHGRSGIRRLGDHGTACGRDGLGALAVDSIRARLGDPHSGSTWPGPATSPVRTFVSPAVAAAGRTGRRSFPFALQATSELPAADELRPAGEQAKVHERKITTGCEVPGSIRAPPPTTWARSHPYV